MTLVRETAASENCTGTSLADILQSALPDTPPSGSCPTSSNSINSTQCNKVSNVSIVKYIVILHYSCKFVCVYVCILAQVFVCFGGLSNTNGFYVNHNNNNNKAVVSTKQFRGCWIGYATTNSMPLLTSLITVFSDRDRVFIFILESLSPRQSR